MTESRTRDVLFISKATPGDDEFVLWLAPRLEAAGYTVFADICSLEPADRWRQQITNTLHERSAKMLLCCSDETLAREGVQEEIGIAKDVGTALKDSRFLIPLRLQPFKKVFGIGEYQWVDFVGSWANGLRDLLDTLEARKVPKTQSPVISPNWEAYRRKLSVKLEQRPESLTSNWLPFQKLPENIFYFQPTGAVNHHQMLLACESASFPIKQHLRGLISFATLEEINQELSSVARFEITAQRPLTQFLEEGLPEPLVKRSEARRLVSEILRRGWEAVCSKRGLSRYTFSSQFGFYAGKDFVGLNKRISWGDGHGRRSAALRNIAHGRVWQFGISATPNFTPMPVIRLKTRVVFSDVSSGEAGAVFDADRQHRFRRSDCKLWRNKIWHGRLMALLELLSSGQATIECPISPTAAFSVWAKPLVVVVPVTTPLKDELPEDEPEQDESTLGNDYPETEDDMP